MMLSLREFDVVCVIASVKLADGFGVYTVLLMAAAGFVCGLPIASYLPCGFRPSACTRSREDPSRILLLPCVLVAAAFRANAILHFWSPAWVVMLVHVVFELNVYIGSRQGNMKLDRVLEGGLPTSTDPHAHCL